MAIGTDPLGISVGIYTRIDAQEGEVSVEHQVCVTGDHDPTHRDLAVMLAVLGALDGIGAEEQVGLMERAMKDPETLTNVRTWVGCALAREPELAFDAMDPATGQLLGQIGVSDPDPNLPAKDCRRMLESEQWTLDTLVQVDIDALNDEGDLYCAVKRRVGTLGDMFDALLAITVVSEDEIP